MISLSHPSSRWNPRTLPPVFLRTAQYIPALSLQNFSCSNASVTVQSIDTISAKILCLHAHITETLKEYLKLLPGYAAFIAVLKGQLQCNLTGYSNVRVHIGQFNIIYPAQEQVPIVLPNGDHVILCILIQTGFILTRLKLLPVLADFAKKMQQQLPALLADKQMFLFNHVYTHIARITNTPYNKELTNWYNQTVSEMLMTTITHAAKWNFNSTVNTHNQQLFQVQQYINDNLNRHITIQTLSRKFGINTKQLKTGFHALFGLTIYQYLKTQRMQAAYNILTNTSQTIKQVTAALGYKTPQSFSRAFKAVFRQSPAQARKMNKQ